uniref:Sodium/calcium exchanger membrane region domain-containing protein n=1 Tax=Arcella intermedia TaxID=1963864 RepID=A0A6B2L7U3_9EUKA
MRHLLMEEEEREENKIENEIKDMDFEESEESLLDNLKHYFDWDQKSKLGRAILIITSPLLLIEHATIHWAKDGKYMKQIYVLHPPAITLFIFFTLDCWTSEIIINGNTLGYWIYWVFPISFLLSLVIFLTASYRAPPKYNPIFIALGGIVSAMWIDFFANELVSCLGTLGKLFNISDAVMGLTIMAWGNSLSDLITDILISYRGYPAMVTSVVYSSPITHILIGLGISFIIKTSKEGPIILTTKGRYPDLTNTLWINFMFLLFGLILTLIVVPITGFRFNRFLGVLLLLIYLSSIALSLLDLFHVLPQTIFWIF